jgi:Flp pilus assembly protein TadG
LATTQPPAQWQSAQAAFTQAVQALAAYDTQRLQAIDERNVSQFVTESVDAPSVMEKFCSPIARFNAGQPSASALVAPDPSSC